MEHKIIRDVPYKMGKYVTRLDYFYPINLNNHSITKPTVICFGGNTTLNERYAGALCKFASNLVGINTESHFNLVNDVDFLGCSYGRFKSVEDNQPYQTTRLEMNEIRDIKNKLFLPLYSNPDGTPKTKDEIIKNFTNITFLSHCYGATVISKLIDLIEFDLKLLKFNNQDRQEILSNIASISFAPMSSIRDIKNITLHSLNDTIIGAKPNSNETDLNGINITQYPDQNAMTIHSSQISNGYDLGLFNEHNIFILNRNTNWELSLKTKLFDEYIFVGKNADALSQILGYLLSESICTGLNNLHSNTPIKRSTIEDNYRDCMDILSSFKKEDLKQKV